jgi:hypothetical protein
MSSLVQIKFITNEKHQAHIIILLLNQNYFNRKVYTTEKKNKLSAAWHGFDGDRLYLNLIKR